MALEMPRVLIVDDDPELCRMVVRYLREDGFDVTAVHNGQRALEAVGASAFDVMVLDIMMPGMNGQEVLRRLQSEAGAGGAIPVLMLTARGDEVDRVIGLETGADDYLAKPCSLRELAARLRAILRRANTRGPARQAPVELTVGQLSINVARRIAHREGRRLELTGAEFAILQMLMQSPGRPVSKESLTRAALGRDYVPYDRSIDVHIANIRKKLDTGGQTGDRRSLIKTIRGAGYLLVEGNES